MRIRGIDLAGGLAVVGVLVLIALSVWPQSPESTSVVVASAGDSVLGTPAPTQSPTSTEAPTAEPTPEATETPAATTEPADDSTNDEPPVEESRGEVRVLVLNAGAPDGAAALITGALAEQGFAPANPANAAAPSEGTRVLFATGQRRAARDIGGIVGASTDDVVRASVDDPNWEGFGSDLDVLVIVGPPLP